MSTLTRFWEQRVKQNLRTGTFAQSALDAQQDIVDLERLKVPNASYAIQVHIRLRGRYYPSGRPNCWKAGDYDYDNETHRCAVLLNLKGLDLVTDLYCSQKVKHGCLEWSEGGEYPLLDYQPNTLPLPIPVGLWGTGSRCVFSFEPLVFNNGHPLLPTFCVSGVVLDKSLAKEMRRKLRPTMTECLFPRLRITQTGLSVVH